MATKLKDLKFGDYTLKGKQAQYGDSRYFELNGCDAFVHVYSKDGVVHEDEVIYYTSLGSDNYTWLFRGLADYASTAYSVGNGDTTALYCNNGTWTYVVSPDAIGCSSSIKLRATNAGSSSFIRLLSPVGSDFCIGYTSSGSSYFMGGVSKLTLDVSTGNAKKYDLSVDSNGFVKASLRQ